MSANITLPNSYFKTSSLQVAKNYCIAIPTNSTTIGSNATSTISFQNNSLSISDTWTILGNSGNQIICGVSGWYKLSFNINITQNISQNAGHVRASVQLLLNGSPIPSDENYTAFLSFPPNSQPSSNILPCNSVSLTQIIYVAQGQYVGLQIGLSLGNSSGIPSYEFGRSNMYIDFIGCV